MYLCPSLLKKTILQSLWLLLPTSLLPALPELLLQVEACLLVAALVAQPCHVVALVICSGPPMQGVHLDQGHPLLVVVASSKVVQFLAERQVALELIILVDLASSRLEFPSRMPLLLQMEHLQWPVPALTHVRCRLLRLLVVLCSASPNLAV